jgi:hypothetical protein
MKPEYLDISDSYIPVGILKRYDIQSNSAPHLAPQDVDFPETELKALEDHGWIRTQCHAYNDYPGWSYVQVYVLPDDCCRELIPRSGTALRRALRVIMSRVDISSEGWEGIFTREELTIQKNTEAPEDESLWYIFNTLATPNPDVQCPKDPFGRRVMQQVLDETSFAAPDERPGLPGLKTSLYPYQRRSAAAMIQREIQPAAALDPRLRSCRTPNGLEYYYDKEEGVVLQDKRLYSEACGGMS